MEAYRVPLMEDWRFQLTDDEQAVLPAYDDSNWRTLDLPHDWQIEQPRDPYAPGGLAQGFFPRNQVGVYRLHFWAQESWRGQCMRVLFDGVQRFSQVYLNGVYIGGHGYGYVPFLCDMTDALRFDAENVLAVRVDNRLPDGVKWYADGGDRWYSGAGVIRDVWLLVDSAARIVHDGITVVATPVLKGPSGDVPDVAGIRCEEAHIAITVEAQGPMEGHTLHLSILAPDGSLLWKQAAPAQKTTYLECTLAHPALWSTENPLCYSLKADLDGITPHSLRFGIRSALFDSEDGFVLNGVKTKLWGVNLHHDGGVVGAAVPEEIWRRRLQALKSMGVNTIRAAHHPMPEYFYDFCDELGFLVIDELYDKWSNSGMYFDRIYDEEHLADLETMIRRDRNHPSVILWSVGNEINHQYSDLFYACLSTLCDHARQLDPTRGVTAALIGFVLKNYNDQTPLGKKLDAAMRYADIVDVFMGNYMEHFYERLRERGMRKPIIGSEVRMYYRLDACAMNNVQTSPESPYAIVRKYDWVCGAILWAGIDYLGESTAWPIRGWTGNALDSTGIWKLRAWYCASQWKNEPLLKLCVYDESEPWDGARGMWGFPQMRSHWKYHEFEKILHVCAMTNCDTVKLYQNSQTVRIGKLSDFPDGMIHFALPYIPGILRAEGYRGGLLVCEDTLYSDHEATALQIEADRTTMPADGRSVAFIDIWLRDAHGRQYMLENRNVQVQCTGVSTQIWMDNGNARAFQPVGNGESETFDGHLLVIVRAGKQPGESTLLFHVEGFEAQTITLRLS